MIFRIGRKISANYRQVEMLITSVTTTTNWLGWLPVWPPLQNGLSHSFPTDLHNSKNNMIFN